MMANFPLALTAGLLGACVVLAQAPTPLLRQGPGVQAAEDARYASVITQCKTPPSAPLVGASAGPTPAPPAAGNTTPREYSVSAIPGVIAPGQQWRTIMSLEGRNADGIVGLDDGSLLIAQNDSSAVLKLAPDGSTSIAYWDTNTGGALSMNAKGQLFVASRMLNPAIVQLAPERRILANRFDGDTLDCLGGVLNDITADSKGGVYFTMGGLFYASPAGVVTSHGDGLRTNGVILSPDEKSLYVTALST